ncbi:MarR family winged helix-turn-helix transcriptional regulator [Paraburkholderia sp. GAS42]|uniref:MarR family winged helix-turn-helix transcriptional regulator n=1 Tax=Paraburkholderia sp. GAS42 TaxID=3035135 RepID=UPI003D1ACB7F
MHYEGYGFVFARATRYISRIYNRHLADVSLTVSQYGILVSIAQSGPIVVQELAERLVIERTALLRTVKPLIAAGFVQAIADPSRKKRLLYQLADKGHQHVEAASACIRSAESEIEGIFARHCILTIRNSLLPVANASRPESDSII